MTRLLLAAGAISPALFVLTFMVEGATRSGYSAWHNFVSNLCLGMRGWVQRVNFYVCGVLMLCFAAGLQHALQSGRGALLGPVLIGVFGLTLILSGVFVGAPNTPQGMAHGLAGKGVFSSLPLACFVLAWRFALEFAWLGWAL